MKEKTLYYRIVIREVDRMVNDGFIIVTICDGKLFSLEGVFSGDYLTAKIDENTVCLEYYSRYEALGQYEKQWKIPIQNECFELPLYIEVHLLSEEDYENMDEDEEEEYEVIKIETLEQISQNSQKERCNEILQKFKKNNKYQKKWKNKKQSDILRKKQKTMGKINTQKRKERDKKWKKV